VGKVDVVLDGKTLGTINLKPSEYIEKQDSTITFGKIIKNWLLIFNSENSQVI
jgi:hypothetical protein